MKNFIFGSILSLYSLNVVASLPGNIETFFNKELRNCFLIKKIGEGEVLSYGQKNCLKKKPPFSTFKILNSLIALETGVVIGNKTIIPWDKKKKFLKVWEKDHNLASAIMYSVVPFYQEIARRVGIDRMQKYITKVDYGNNTTGNVIDRFWLDGPLEVTAHEQLKFVERLYLKNLPFKKVHQDLVIRNIVLEKNDSREFSGKTGSEYKKGRFVFGWFVGHIKNKNSEYVFVISNKGESASGSKAKAVAKRILLEMNI